MTLFIVQTAIRVHDSVCVEITVRGIVRFVISDGKLVAKTIRLGRRYYFEYTLIAGENCDEEHAQGLIELLKGKPCHVNLIRLNEVKERDLKSTGDKDAYRFLGWLEKGGLSATLRRQIGVDIGGACGQLRASYLEGDTPKA